MQHQKPWYILWDEPSEDPVIQRNRRLFEACHKMDEELVRELLEQGADAAFERNDPGVWGASKKISPIHVAIINLKHENGLPVIKLLLEAGAKVGAPMSEYDWRGCGHSSTAWEMAVQTEDIGLLRLCLKHGGDANTASTTSRSSMRTDGRSKWYMLHTAVEKGNVELVKLLLEAGAEVDAIKSDVYHNERGYNQNNKATSLHLATLRGNFAIVKLLVEAGADIDLPYHHTCHDENPDFDEDGEDDPRQDGYVSPVICVPEVQTALAIAIQKRKTEIVNFLAFKGANIHIKYKRGNKESSILDLCSEHGVLIGWTPAIHKTLPAHTKFKVMATLLSFSRQNVRLPSAIIEEILQAAISLS